MSIGNSEFFVQGDRPTVTRREGGLGSGGSAVPSRPLTVSKYRAATVRAVLASGGRFNTATMVEPNKKREGHA